MQLRHYWMIASSHHHPVSSSRAGWIKIKECFISVLRFLTYPQQVSANMFPPNLLLFCLVPLISAQESVLGVYIFHRHGDRTAKSWPPTALTDLGYNEVWQSGNFYRNRYIDTNGTSRILNINAKLVNNAQLNIQSPVDNVLQTSAQGFLQGLYPPAGATLGSVQIANGSTVEAPMNGYQLIPIQSVSSSVTGTDSESSTWLQGSRLVLYTETAN